MNSEWTTSEVEKTMRVIFRAAGIRTLPTETHQLPEDIKEAGVIFKFVCTKEEYFRVRDAASEAGLWLKVVWKRLSPHTFEYSILVVPREEKL